MGLLIRKYSNLKLLANRSIKWNFLPLSREERCCKFSKLTEIFVGIRALFKLPNRTLRYDKNCQLELLAMWASIWKFRVRMKVYEDIMHYFAKFTKTIVNSRVREEKPLDIAKF